MNAYFTDGTEEGFFTAVFDAFRDRDGIVTSSRTFQMPIGCTPVDVASDEEKAARVKKKLRQYAPKSVREISLLLRSGNGQKEQIALEYVRLIMQKRAAVSEMLSLPAVIAAAEEIKKVTSEAHRFTGFLRFMESSEGIFYAPFSPDNDILDLILPHFMRRLKNQPFVIHDTLRNKAALYNTKECVIAQTEEKISLSLSEREASFQSLWKGYYASVNVAERPHEKQMKNYMPVRYWKYMPEKNGP